MPDMPVRRSTKAVDRVRVFLDYFSTSYATAAFLVALGAILLEALGISFGSVAGAFLIYAARHLATKRIYPQVTLNQETPDRPRPIRSLLEEEERKGVL